MANTNPSPNCEEPPLPDIHENPEPNWELLLASWAPDPNYPKEDEPPPHWISPPPIPDPKTAPVDARETELSGVAYHDYKFAQIRAINDLMSNVTSFNGGEIKRCFEWLMLIRKQCDEKLAGIAEAEVDERDKLKEVIVEVRRVLKKALWFLRKKF